MDKMIKGKRYNTKTAKLVGEWSNGEGYNDFDFCAESLYRKRNGEFFIHGEGGARSRYAVSESYSSDIGGSRLMPVSLGEAKEWAEKHLDGDEYEDIFGDPEEGETCAIYAVIDAAAKNKLDAYALDNGKTIGSVVTELINSL